MLNLLLKSLVPPHPTITQVPQKDLSLLASFGWSIDIMKLDIYRLSHFKYCVWTFVMLENVIG